MHPQFNALDLIGLDALVAQLHARVDAGVDHDSGTEWLVAVERNLEPLAKCIGDFIPGVLGRRENPRGPSSACWLAVKPYCANNVDIIPARVAAPGWKGLVMVPNCSRRPTG